MFLQVQNHISVKPFETDLIKYRPLESHRHVPTREKPFAFAFVLIIKQLHCMNINIWSLCKILK